MNDYLLTGNIDSNDIIAISITVSSPMNSYFFLIFLVLK